MTRILFFIIIIIVLIWFYVRFFEWKNIYYPERPLLADPSMHGLSYEDVFFSTSDGKKLHGWFLPGKSEYPTLLYCHGNAGNISYRIDALRVLVAAGFSVFIFDYRGYGQSAGFPTEQGTYRDAEAAYDYLVKSRKVAPGKIVALGRSLGGAVAVHLATQRPLAALICESSFSSIMAIGKEMYPFLPIDLVVTMRYNSAEKIKHITVPKLIMHSVEDGVIPFAHGERLFAAAAEPKHFYAAHGDHGEGVYSDADAYIAEMCSFLRQYGIL